jgi:MFS family permease
MSSTPAVVPESAHEPDSLFDPRVRGVTTAILLIVGLSAFEGLAVAAALPQVAAALGSVALLPWVITAYLLMSGVSTVAAGALVDRVGLAPIFRASVILFVTGGVLAGLAPNMPLLVAARVLQGTGAGAVNAVGLTAVGLVFPRKLVAHAFAANSTVWGVMSVAGPALAALILTVASWRWIFLLNLPFGAIALWFGWSALPAKPARSGGSAVRPLDLFLLTVLTGLVLAGVDALSWRSIPMLGGAVAIGVLLARKNRGDSDALLAPRHAIDAPLGPLAGGIALLLVGGIGLQSFVPLLVNGGRGASIAFTAVSVLFFPIGWTTGANTASRLNGRFTPLQLIGAGASLVPVALGLAAMAAAFRWPLPILFAGLLMAGLGTGAATNCGLTLLRDLVEDDELGRASAAHQFIRNLGFAMGNALFGAVLLLVVGTLTGDVETIRATLSEGADVAIDPGVADAIQAGFAVAAVVGAAISVFAIVPIWTLRSHVSSADSR